MTSGNVRTCAATLAVLSFLLFCCCLSARTDEANLKSLYDGHRWFELRDAVEKQGASAFYQGAVACAFNDLSRCEKKFGEVFRSEAQSDDAVEAHRVLASAYLIRGKYKKALAQVDAILALKPSDSDALGGRPILAALAEFPDQEHSGRHASVKLQDGGLPFSINGVRATYWFDTGAELSVLSESEAKRFGLKIIPTTGKAGDVNGTEVNTQIAVADELSIGAVRLKNVAFLVLPDSQPPFDQGSPGSRGLIGLPVLQALERFTWKSDETFEIGPESGDKNAPHAALCYDGNHPLVQIQYEGHGLAFVLDTGATNTDLFPPFAAAFPELIASATKTDSYKMEGIGGAKYMDAAKLEAVKFSISGVPVTLKPAGVLLKPTSGSSKFFAGNLGIDLLQQAHERTFDFKKMTLTLR